MTVKPEESKSWAKEKLTGLITTLVPTFTNAMDGLNEKAISHDIGRIAQQGFSAFSIVTEAGTTPEETKEFIDISVKHAKGRLMTVLLTTFSTVEENLEMVKYARDAGVDMLQLGYPSMWRPGSLDEVVEYTRKVCRASGLPTLLWAAEMWGWCQLLPDSYNYPRELLLKFAAIPSVIAIKSGTKDRKVLAEIYSKGIVPGTVVEGNWPTWIKEFNGQWGGISMYNHLYFCTEYFGLLRKGNWEKGMELYFRMSPIRQVWDRMLRAETGMDDLEWSWTGHNRLRWKYASWLVGLNGGPIRGHFRISPLDMRRLRRALTASSIPVTTDDDARFFEGRNPA